MSPPAPLAEAVAIEPYGLAIAAGFILFVVAVVHRFQLGLVRTVLVAATRCYVQLMLLGLVLVYLFSWDHPALTGAAFGVMILFSGYTTASRLREVPVPVLRPVLAALAGGGLLITLVVTLLVVQVEPFWQARYWLPIGGMVLGNSMTGIAIAVERFFGDIELRRPQVLALIALGARPQEAARGSLRAALRAGMIPILNNMAAVGVVSIPGMMTGQVLAGADPQQAARYQIVVMLMISASTALGAIAAVWSCGRKAFDEEGALREFHPQEGDS